MVISSKYLEYEFKIGDDKFNFDSINSVISESSAFFDLSFVNVPLISRISSLVKVLTSLVSLKVLLVKFKIILPAIWILKHNKRKKSYNKLLMIIR